MFRHLFLLNSRCNVSPEKRQKTGRSFWRNLKKNGLQRRMKKQLPIGQNSLMKKLQLSGTA